VKVIKTDRFLSHIPAQYHSLESPVSAQSDGIKLKPEDMEINKLYHCIFENKVYLFYKDDDSLLHCYEVENHDAVKEISQNPLEFEAILRKYSKE
jgi:hypothetical protein